MTKNRVIPVVLMSLLILIGASVFFIEKKDVRASFCAECGREIYRDWAFTITTSENKQETLCCPRCGLLAMLAKGASPHQALATDFAAGKRIPADTATYVWGSDANHCAMPQKVSQFDQQPMELVFDRCFPSAVAFARKTDAEEFAKQHHGEVLSFDAMVQLLRHTTGQP